MISIQFMIFIGFKTPYGIFAIGGLHCLPIFMFAQKNQFFHPNIIPSWITTICMIKPF